MTLRLFRMIFGTPVAPNPDPLLGAVLVLRRSLQTERTPLDIQRFLYLAQVEYAGHRSRSIFPDIFNATSLGPIIPRLMPLLKRKRAIVDPIHITALAPETIALLERIAADYGSYTPGQLVGITHDDASAWANYYTPRACRSTYTGRRIPIEALREEYEARAAGYSVASAAA